LILLDCDLADTVLPNNAAALAEVPIKARLDIPFLPLFFDLSLMTFYLGYFFKNALNSISK
jgi:hypothetical protein|tara:strand:- start:275 stop:457 length:183 start_codon:yes stop_codon:yes gene_type:complete